MARNKKLNILACQKEKLLELFCLLKTGSDATSTKTTAIDKGDHYLLNGTLKLDYKRIFASTIVIAQTDVKKA
jgi:hypothetical protein